MLAPMFSASGVEAVRYRTFADGAQSFTSSSVLATSAFATIGLPPLNPDAPQPPPLHAQGRFPGLTGPDRRDRIVEGVGRRLGEVLGGKKEK
jgi:hypothetical protein